MKRPGPIRVAASCRSLCALVLVALGAAACLDPEPPVLFVPYRTTRSAGDPIVIADDAVRRLGFEVARADAARGLLVTHWKIETTMIGTQRKRIELRFQPGPLPGFALAVPSQLQEGDRWMYYGEDEELRQRVVATLQSRMLADP